MRRPWDDLLGWSLASTASTAVRGRADKCLTRAGIHLFKLLQIRSNDHLASIRQLLLTVVTDTHSEGIFELIGELPHCNSFLRRKQASIILALFQLYILPDQTHIRLTCLVLSKRPRSKVSGIISKSPVSFGSSFVVASFSGLELSFAS